MSKSRLEQAQHLTEKLLVQYQQYLATSAEIDKLKSRQMQAAVRIGHKSGRPFTVVLAENPPELAAVGRDIAEAEARTQRISDEMTFANPIVWMMYKFKAYAGTSQAILDMQDFRLHCSKPGYICTKRFKFLNESLRASGPGLDDVAAYPDNLRLDAVYTSSAITGIVDDKKIMAAWSDREYYLDGSRIAKWENA